MDDFGAAPSPEELEGAGAGGRGSFSDSFDRATRSVTLEGVRVKESAFVEVTIHGVIEPSPRSRRSSTTVRLHG